MIPMRRTWVRLPSASAALARLAIIAVLLSTAGCNSDFFGSTSGAVGTPAADRIHAQANDALARWADAVKKSGGATISFVGELTGQIGDWEESVGDSNKLALLAGLLTASTALPDTAPSRSSVHWVDGSSVDVDVLSAADALADLVAAGAGDCPDCRALRVMDAKLAKSLVETSIGPAEVPVWVFTIDGTAVRVTRVAVDPSVTVVPPPWNADHPPEGVSIDRAIGKSDSRKLTVSFVGAAKHADGACGTDYTAEAVESTLAVVVIIVEHQDPRCPGSDLVGHDRSATVTLAEPLGKRAVLEVRQGLPVPVSPS